MHPAQLFAKSVHTRKRKVTRSGINEACCRGQEEIGGDDSQQIKTQYWERKM